MRTFAIVNQKGGCGKTTTAINLAGVFANRGYRTLLCDMDPQGHCAAGLAIPEQRVDLHIGDAMLAPPEHPVDPTRLLWRVSRNLDLAPATVKLAALEAARGELAKLEDAESRLKRVLGRFQHQYDIALIDCSPAIGMLAFNALVAADEVIIPVETGFFSLQGATKQVNAIKAIGKRLGVAPIHRLLATLHDGSSILSQDLLDELRRRFDNRVIPVVIRQDHALREAASFGQPVIEYARESTGAKDYSALADWLIEHALKNVSMPADTKPEVRVVPGVTEQVLGSPTISPVLATHAAHDPSALISTSRAADVAQRTRKLHRAASIAEAKPTALMAQMHDLPPVLAPTPKSDPFQTHAPQPVPPPAALSTPAPVSTQVSAPVSAPPPPTHSAVLENTPRIFGVQTTPRGVLFVQPVNIGQSVRIAGEFNNWRPESAPLRVNPHTGVLEALLDIPPGSWQYRLVVDDKWMPDPFNPVSAPNPFGGANSVVSVPALTMRSEQPLHRSVG
ncbi:MAG: AAA family ATPase [Phycisphaerales bacterium]|nr:AAA family ATPase [Phycisphaerales bacterium]